MIRVVDLFAGCGGLSLGLAQSKFEVVAGIDNWKPSIEVYRQNFSHPVFEQDLSNISSTMKILNNLEFDVLAGGPPCQDFSAAGKRDINGGRADLTYSFADLVLESKPNYFIMENVERIRKSHILYEIIDEFVEAGYGLTAVLLDASYCGAPQARTRFFLLGHLGGAHNFLLEFLKSSLLKKPLTMRDYFGDSLGIDYYYRHPRNYNRRGIYGLDEPSATIRGVNRPVPPGYSLHSNDPQAIELDEVRPLTTDERALVQTFPRDFTWIGSKTTREQMIGNAVPVALAKFVGTALNEYIENAPIAESTFLPLLIDQPILMPTKTLDKAIGGTVAYKPKKGNAKSVRKAKAS